MKPFYFLIVSAFFIGCQKTTFADNISLVFPKNTKMKIQEFNEGGNESGTNLLYIGKIKPNIDIKYFSTILQEPPPPPKFKEKTEDYERRIKKTEDSVKHSKNLYFRTESIKIFDGKEISFMDSLSNKNLEIIVKENDTIPLYKRDYDTKEIKRYKAFPVFIKNISGKVLKIPEEFNDVVFYFKNNKKQYQFLRNSNYMICGGTGTITFPYFELKPNEILIFAYPYFKKGGNRKAKVIFYNAFSKEFNISIDENIIKNQRDTRILK